MKPKAINSACSRRGFIRSGCLSVILALSAWRLDLRAQSFGSFSDQPFLASTDSDTETLDTFDTYTPGNEVENLNGGTGWDASYISHGMLEPASDYFDTYTDGEDLDGLNEGILWDGAFVSRADPGPAEDDFQSYSDTDDLDGLNGGDNWDAAFVSRP